MPTLDESLATLDALTLSTGAGASGTAHAARADQKLAGELVLLERAQKSTATSARAAKRVMTDALAGFSDEHDAMVDDLDGLKTALADDLKTATIDALAATPYTELGATTGAKKTKLKKAWTDATDDPEALYTTKAAAADVAATARDAAHAAVRVARANFSAKLDLLRSTMRRRRDGVDAIEASIAAASDPQQPASRRLDAALRAARQREALAAAIADGGFSASAATAARKAAYLSVLTDAKDAYTAALQVAVAADTTWFEAEAARLQADRDRAVAKMGGTERTAQAIADEAATL